jgi:beta-mannanase
MLLRSWKKHRQKYWRKQFWMTALALMSMTTVIVMQMSMPAPALLGVYDPGRVFNAGLSTQPAAIALEHHFVPWRLDNANELIQALDQAQAHQRIPLITLESWPWNWQGMTAATLLQDIAVGRYDQTIERCLKVMQARSPEKILLRWGHEMEIVGQYPWSVSDSAAYIAAYRHWVDKATQLGVNNLIWVWSPAGNNNAVNYWPGDDVVDVVGVSIYATPEWHPDRKAELPSFQRLMRQKESVFSRWHKPVIVAEVGVNADATTQQVWLTQAISQLKQFPQVIGWVYFNQIQPEIVPLEIQRPDWSLDAQSTHYLLQHWPQPQSDRSAQEKLAELVGVKMTRSRYALP